MQEVYQARSKSELLESIGDMRQIAGFQRMQLLGGKGGGNEIFQVRNGSGLQFQISVSRAFDLGLCEFYGIPISWISSTGPVSPYFYEKDGTEWERGFEGGMLATCGLTTMGKPSVDLGEAFGLHGRIAHTPAEVLQAESRWSGEEYELIFRGKVREAKALGENVTLERTISTTLGVNRLNIVDRITNDAFRPVEHLILYHFNFGYPLVSDSCRILLPDSDKRWIRGSGPTDGADRYGKPSEQAEPTVMLHERQNADESGTVRIAIENTVRHNGHDKRLKAELSYSREACPYLTQWKHERSGIRVLGLEPGNASTEGRGFHREHGSLPFLQPGETKEYRFALDLQLLEA